MAAIDSAEPPDSMVKPMMVNAIMANAHAGTVVQTMWRMCVNRSLPAIAGAKFVVSDIGESLSPRYAPLMMAPAVIAGSMPMAVATPMRATPTVPAVDHEDPVTTLMHEQTAHVAGKKNAGCRSARPQLMSAGTMPAAIHVAMSMAIVSKMSTAPIDRWMVCKHARMDRGPTPAESPGYQRRDAGRNRQR